MAGNHRVRNLLIVILCAFLSALFSFLPYVLRNDLWLTLNTDFNLQQIPFTISLHNAVSEGGISGWVWNYDLGGSIIQSFSFYELGSPFFWLSMPFPAESFPYLVSALYVLKYVTAAVTAFLYLSRMVKKCRSAAVGAILYAFSGFQAVNLMFYHFHDVVALFPLMLLGIEKVHENPKHKGFFTMAVALNCLVNYFFFVQNVIFCVLYFLFRFGRRKNWRAMLPALFSCLICGIWGICISAVVFLPSLLYIVSSPRAGWMPLSPLPSPRFALYALRGMLFPGEAMSSQSSLFPAEWSSVGCWLPMIGMTLTVAYLRGKKKDRLSGMLILLLILSFSPLLASSFYLFTAWYYRWWYFLVLMAALASGRVLDCPEEYPVRSGTVFSMISVPALYLVLRFVPGLIEDNTLVYDPKKLFIFAVIAFSGVVLTELLRKTRKLDSVWLLCGVCVFAAISTSLTVDYYGALENQQTIRRDIRIGTRLEAEDPQYRYAEGYNILTLSGNAAGTSAFSSTLSGGSMEFDELFDFYHSSPNQESVVQTLFEVIRDEGLNIPRIVDRMKSLKANQINVSTNLSLNKSSVPGLNALLGAKYHISYSEPDRPVVRKIDAGDDASAYVWEDEACPIGFAVDRYILKDDLLSLPRDLRGAVLMQAAVIRPDDADQLRGLCSQTDGRDIRLENIPEYIAADQEIAVRDFVRSTSGFSCRSSYTSPAAVYFAVPYDAGWTARVDDAETGIIDSGGMMLLTVPEGDHRIVFTYETPGYRAGKWISLLSLSLWFLFVLLGPVRSRIAGRRPAD